MGQLVSWMRSSGESDVFIDLDSADVEPSEKESALYQRVAQSLERSRKILAEIDDYKGCQDLARKAMANATKENEEAAFMALLGAVNSIKIFFDFAKELEDIFPTVLDSLAQPSDNKNHSLQNQQALARQLAQLFDFVLQFDQTRMLRPHLSNDFSYYRRLLPKYNKHPRVVVKEDEANAMALFTAEHIPMMSAVARATSLYVRNNPGSNIPAVLAAMSNVCMYMLKSKKLATQKTNILCARAMTGSLVLFDHVDPLGAFWKRSAVKAHDVISTLKKEHHVEPLLNAIRFSSKHFKDDTTPSSIHALFA